ncbi:MAG: hypothetical protein IPJ82_24960 [Lewinellaceae bacterium]|nr:hypothetical protein [Lewinellaceae bacterium]
MTYVREAKLGFERPGNMGPTWFGAAKRGGADVIKNELAGKPGIARSFDERQISSESAP